MRKDTIIFVGVVLALIVALGFATDVLPFSQQLATTSFGDSDDPASLVAAKMAFVDLAIDSDRPASIRPDDNGQVVISFGDQFDKEYISRHVSNGVALWDVQVAYSLELDYCPLESTNSFVSLYDKGACAPACPTCAVCEDCVVVTPQTALGTHGRLVLIIGVFVFVAFLFVVFGKRKK